MLNKIVIIVTFYVGSGSEIENRLSKRYALKNWVHESDLRQLLDQIAQELNHISGYGIWAIKVQSDQLNFTVSYQDKYKPCQDGIHLRFYDSLRFEIGKYTGWRRGHVRIEIPRVRLTTGYDQPIKKYQPNDNLFQIKAVAVGRRKNARHFSTKYHLDYDKTNPYLVSFLQKLREDTLGPVTEHDWQQTGSIVVSWWELPKTQTSRHKRQKAEKRQEAEEREQKRIEKAGVIYKDRKKKQKANQVYLIKVENSDLPDVYKIGISNAPGKRLQSLNTSNPFTLTLVHKFVAEPAEEAESRLHAIFESSRISGEWFRLTPEQIADLKRITEFKNGQFIKSQDTSAMSVPQVNEEQNQAIQEILNQNGGNSMSVQNFALGFSVSELVLDDLLWLYEHNQNHKDTYSVKVTIMRGSESDLLQLKSAKIFNVSISFKAWNIDTTNCVNELLMRFKPD